MTCTWPVAGPSAYQMLTDHDCGCRAMVAASGRPAAVIQDAWTAEEYDNLLADINDSPWHHWAVLRRLGLQWKIRTCRDLLTVNATPGKTLVLIHPNARHPLLVQHWVVYDGMAAGSVRLHWGDGTIRLVPSPDFEEMYARGTPACAYEIVESGGQSQLTWFQRLWVWLMGRFA